MSRNQKIAFWSILALVIAVGVEVAVVLVDYLSLSVTAETWIAILVISLWVAVSARVGYSTYRDLTGEAASEKVLGEAQSFFPASVVDRATQEYNHSLQRTLIGREWAHLTPSERESWLKKAAESIKKH